MATRLGGEVAACQARRRRLCCQSLPRFLPLHRPLLPLFIVVNPLRRSRGIFPPLDHLHEGGDRPVRMGLSNEAIPQDLDGRRPESRRWLSGPATSWWGPVGPEQAPGGGIDIDYCAFPTCPGNPRGIVSAPALRFCTLLPPPPSPTSTICFSSSAASVSPSVCLSVSLSFSPSLSLSIRFCLSLAFLPVFLHLGREIKESTHPWIFSRESVRRFVFTRRCQNCHGDRMRLYYLLRRIPSARVPEDERQHSGRYSYIR